MTIRGPSTKEIRRNQNRLGKTLTGTEISGVRPVFPHYVARPGKIADPSPWLGPIERFVGSVGVEPGIARRAPGSGFQRGSALRVAGELPGVAGLAGAPRAQRSERCSQFPSGFRQRVRQSDRLIRIGRGNDQSIDLKLSQSLGEDVRGDSFDIGHQFVKSARTTHQRVNEEEGPTVADAIEG